MKNRKRAIVAFMLVACMLLGVGYAAITTHLNIQGGATVTVEGSTEAFSADVRFTHVDTGTDAAKFATASIGDGKTADFSVTGLKGAGDTATLTYTITNSGDLDATVTVDGTNTTNNNDAYFTVTTEWIDSDQDLEKNGGTAQLKVTISLDHTPSNSTAPTTAQFNIRLNVTSVDP